MIWNHHVVIMEILLLEKQLQNPIYCCIYSIVKLGNRLHTVDGRIMKNSCTTWGVQNLANSDINHLSTGAGFLPSTGLHQFGMFNTLRLSRRCNFVKTNRSQDTTSQRLSLAALVCVSLARPPNLQSEALQMLRLQGGQESLAKHREKTK